MLTALSYTFFSVVVFFILIYSTCIYRKVLIARRLLEWVPQIPRKPLIGNLLEFGESTETLENITRLTTNQDKMAYFEFIYEWGILTYNHDLVKFVLSSNDILDKAVYYNFFHPWLGTGLLTSTGAKWKSMRRIITPAFHFSSLKQFVVTFNLHCDILVHRLKELATKQQEVNISDYVNPCSLDTICDSAMGVSTDSQNNKNKEYVNAVKDYCRIVLKRAFCCWRGCEILFRVTQEYWKQRQNVKVLHGFSNSVIENRRSLLRKKTVDRANNKTKRLPFLDLLFQATIDGKPLSQKNIREEVDTFIFEGHDTTSSAAASVLYLLANHSNIQQLVREEQLLIYGINKKRETTYQDLLDMKYLDLVINESLRLYPPVPLISRQVKKDISYESHVIPKGTLISIFIYGINRDPQFYENPDEFNPDRFLNRSADYPFSYLPFSAGPRNCIGQKFAILEIKCLVSKIIKNYELYTTDPPHKLVLANEAVLKSINGVKIKLKNFSWPTESDI